MLLPGGVEPDVQAVLVEPGRPLKNLADRYPVRAGGFQHGFDLRKNGSPALRFPLRLHGRRLSRFGFRSGRGLSKKSAVDFAEAFLELGLFTDQKGVEPFEFGYGAGIGGAFFHSGSPEKLDTVSWV